MIRPGTPRPPTRWRWRWRCWCCCHVAALTGDGGGKVPALARALRGRHRVVRTVINWVRRVARLPGVSLLPVELNGSPGALLLDAQQRLIGACAIDMADGQITSISGIVNPDKLTT